MKTKTIAMIITALMMALLLAVPALAQENTGAGTYEVTIESLTTGQPDSPPVAATHDGSISVFQEGGQASLELEAIAEDGNPMPLATLLEGSDGVTDVVNVGRPLSPQGTEKVVKGKTVTDNATFDIQGAPGDTFSIATMLLCTNDGFTGLNGAQLPESGSVQYDLVSYDAGTENVTEQSQDMVDPCSALGPVKLPGDPDGNRGMGPEDVAISTVPQEPIQPHPGIQGVGELSQATHGWTDPVASVTITKLDDVPVVMPDTGGMSLLLPAIAALLLGSGILGLAVARRQRAS